MATNTDSSPRYLNLKQAAARYGISTVMLRKLVRRGRLTGYKPTRRTLLSVEELEKLVADGAAK